MNEIEGFQNNVAGEGWPVIFPVCTTHKHDLFAGNGHTGTFFTAAPG